MSDVDVVVVGGGPCGLTAALAAARAGRSTRLVEASPRLGGMAAGHEVAGVRVDLGSHRFHPAAEPRVRGLVDELLGDDLQTRERNGRLRLRDRWVAFPFRPADLVRSVPPGFVAAAARDALTGRFRHPEGDSYAEVVRVGLGPAALADFHGPMAAKLWGVPPERLAGELARKRLAVRSPGALARTIARTSRPTGRVFLYPRLGYGQIVDRLADAATEAGAELSTGAAVSQLDLDPATPTVRLADGTQLHAGRVLWTAPLAPLSSAVAAGGGAPAPDDGPAMRGLVLAFLVVPTRRWTSFDAHYVPTPGVVFSRLSEPRNYRDGPDPDGLTVLCAEIPCAAGDELWSATAEAIRDQVVDGIARCDLPAVTVDHVEVVRLPSVYPLLTVDDPTDRGRSLAWADGLDGVTVLGRQGRLVADNLHHVMAMALDAVDCLRPDGRWDATGWATATRRFDEFVVQD